MLKDKAIGSKIGDNTIIAGVVSIKHPTINSKIFIKSKITNLLSDMPNIMFVTIVGICCIVRILVNAVAHPIITIVVPVVEQAFPIVLNNLPGFISLWIKTPQINAYTAATAAASVGVKMPP